MRRMRRTIAVWLVGLGMAASPLSAEAVLPGWWPGQLIGQAILVEPGTDTLKDAVAAAPPGSVLLLKPGQYEVTSTVLIDKSLTIRGQTTNPADVHIAAIDAEEFNFEEAIFVEETDRGHILFATAGAESVQFAFFTINNAPETDVDEGFCTEEPPEGLGLNHSECFGDGIHTDGVATVIVRNVRASINAGNGIFVDGARNVVIDNVVALNNGAFGLDVDSVLDLRVRNSRFVGNQISGIEAAGHAAGTPRADYTAYVRIDATTAEANGEIGIEVERFETAELKHVTCSDNREDGFDADRVSRVVISLSSFLNNVDDGLELFPVDVPPEEQPADFPGSIIESFFRLKVEGNLGKEINRPPTEN